MDTLPDEFLDYTVVNCEVGIIDEKYHYRVDKPITTLLVDEETNEVIILNDSQDTPTNNEDK